MCALPSAQLGSMANLSVPSYVPTVQRQKEPKLWEKALMTILTQAGTQAVSQGVGNAMANDNAAEFGKTPRSGFGKLLAPVVNDTEASRLRADDSASQRQQFGLDSERMRQDKGIEADTQKDIRGFSEQGLRDIDRDIAARSLEKLRSTNDLGRDAQKFENEQAVARLTAELTGRDPYHVALANAAEANSQSTRKRADSDAMLDVGKLREQNAKASGEEMRAKMVQQELERTNGKPGGKPGAVNPNVAKFAQGAKASTMSPEDAAVVEMLRQALNPGVPRVGPTPGVPSTANVPPEELLKQLSGFLQ